MKNMHFHVTKNGYVTFGRTPLQMFVTVRHLFADPPTGLRNLWMSPMHHFAGNGHFFSALRGLSVIRLHHK